MCNRNGHENVKYLEQMWIWFHIIYSLSTVINVLSFRFFLCCAGLATLCGVESTIVHTLSFDFNSTPRRARRDGCEKNWLSPSTVEKECWKIDRSVIVAGKREQFMAMKVALFKLWRFSAPYTFYRSSICQGGEKVEGRRESFYA